MRRRRAERCVLRAEVALEAGFEEDARAALDEARRLDPHSPELEALSGKIQTRRAAQAMEQGRLRRRRLSAYAAAALLVVSAGTAAVVLRDGSDGPPSSSTSTTSSTSSPGAALATAPVPPPTVTQGPAANVAREDALEVRTELQPVAPVPAAVVPFSTDLLPDRTAQREPALAQKASGTSRETSDAVAASPAPSRPLVVPATADLAPVTGLRDAPAPTPPAAPEAMTTPPVVPAASGVEELPGTTAAPAEPRVISAPPLDEAGVRAVLARYEAAYTTLNAPAAQAVWPGVDLRSLSRAFDSLESQRVSLGRCAVTLTGAKASANCAGSATWTPKVGGGTRTEARHWRFELANTGRAWQIVRAEAR